MFLPAPFTRKAMITLDSRDPVDAIIATKRALDELKAENNKEDSEMIKEAEDHATEYAAWLSGMILGKIPEIKYEVAPDDNELSYYKKERHSRCIRVYLKNNSYYQNPEDNEGVTLQLNATVNAHAEAARESNTLRKQELDRLKDKDN